MTNVFDLIGQTMLWVLNRPYYWVRDFLNKTLEKWSIESKNRKYSTFFGVRFTVLYICCDMMCGLLQGRAAFAADSLWYYLASVIFLGFFLATGGWKISRLIEKQKQKKNIKDGFELLVGGVAHRILRVYFDRMDEDGIDAISPGTDANPIFYFRKECSWKWYKATIHYREEFDGASGYDLLDIEYAKLELEILSNKRTAEEDMVFEQLRGNHVQVLKPNDLWTS